MSFMFKIYFIIKFIYCKILCLFIIFSEVLLVLMVSGGNAQIWNTSSHSGSNWNEKIWMTYELTTPY